MRGTRLKAVQMLLALVGLLSLASAFPSVRLSLAEGPADGPDYTVEWWTVDGGGITAVGAGSPGSYTLDSTSGQPDAGHALSNGGYVLVGGFGAGIGPVLGANSVYLPLVLKN